MMVTESSCTSLRSSGRTVLLHIGHNASVALSRRLCVCVCVGGGGWGDQQVHTAFVLHLLNSEYRAGKSHSGHLVQSSFTKCRP